MTRRRQWAGLSLVFLLSMALLSGALYEHIGRARARSLYPPLGRLVDIGGRRLQLDCRGMGSSTVVFESGRGYDGSLSWYRVQDEVAKTSRACAYSRAGVLWSDPTSGPHTGRAEAFDLHTALQRSGEHPPFVLVGHSAGGINVVIYTKYFGAEVAGIVLVDSSHPDQVSRFKAETGAAPSNHLIAAKIARALVWTGLFRLLYPTPNSHAPLAMKIISAYAPVSFGAVLDEQEAAPETFAEAEDARSTIGSRPLFVLTHGLTSGSPKDFEEVWRRLQDEEATWSSNSIHETVADSHHDIQLEQPERVVAAVRWAIDQVRAQQGLSGAK